MFPKVTGVFGKPRLFPVRCSKIRLLSNSKCRNDVYLANGIAPKAISLGSIKSVVMEKDGGYCSKLEALLKMVH